MLLDHEELATSLTARSRRRRRRFRGFGEVPFATVLFESFWRVRIRIRSRYQIQKRFWQSLLELQYGREQVAGLFRSFKSDVGFEEEGGCIFVFESFAQFIPAHRHRYEGPLRFGPQRIYRDRGLVF